ncbi:DUF6480 family protein [Isoptericola sp. CG 20/1183]|nr:DUF6480 family protein [Isoptericola sp. CG 20/1183]
METNLDTTEASMTHDADDRAHRPDPEPGRDSETDVQPGDTPPAAGQVSAPQGHDEHGPRRATPWVWLVAIGVVVVLAAAYFVGYGIGLFD